MNVNKLIGVLSVAVTLAGCGGGGSPAVPPSNSQPPPLAVDALPGGHWFGTLTNEFNMVTEEYVAMVDESGRFRFVSVDSAVQMSGNLAISRNTLSGDGTAFADEGVVWLDGTSASSISLSGTITERTAMSGTWTSASAEFGSFEFFYDPTFYERASALALLAGTWIAYDDLLNPEVTFTILADGSFTGQNTRGCNTVGQFALIDSAFNLYEVQSTISDCAIAGQYVGLALLADLLAPNDVLLFAVDNGSRATALGFER